MHLKTCSCQGHRAKEQLQFTQSWLTKITSTRVHYVIRDIIQGNAQFANREHQWCNAWQRYFSKHMNVSNFPCLLVIWWMQITLDASFCSSFYFFLNVTVNLLSFPPPLPPSVTGTMALCPMEIGVDGKADLRYTGGPKPMVLSQALCTSSTHPRPARYRTDQRMNKRFILQTLERELTIACLSFDVCFRRSMRLGN